MSQPTEDQIRTRIAEIEQNLQRLKPIFTDNHTGQRVFQLTGGRYLVYYTLNHLPTYLVVAPDGQVIDAVYGMVDKADLLVAINRLISAGRRDIAVLVQQWAYRQGHGTIQITQG